MPKIVPTYDNNLKLRIESKVIRNSDNQCSLWTGCKTKFGHGVIKIKGVMYYVHRIVFFNTYPDEKQNLIVMHICDNPACCRIDHLRAGTKAMNNTDRAVKGRNSDQRGSKNHMFKISEEIVLKIKELYNTGIYTFEDIAQKLGISESSACRKYNH